MEEIRSPAIMYSVMSRGEVQRLKLDIMRLNHFARKPGRCSIQVHTVSTPLNPIYVGKMGFVEV